MPVPKEEKKKLGLRGGGGGIGEEIIPDWTGSWIYKTQEEKFPSEGKWVVLNVDGICSLLGSSSESFVPLNFVSGEQHTLINTECIGSALDLHFLLRNTIIKFVCFLRAPVLFGWSTRELFSLWMCGFNSKVGFFRTWKAQR